MLPTWIDNTVLRRHDQQSNVLPLSSKTMDAVLRSAVLDKRRRTAAYPTGWACGSSCAAACSRG